MVSVLIILVPAMMTPAGRRALAGSFSFGRDSDAPTCWGCPPANPNKFELPVRPPRQFPENHYTRRYNDWIGQKQEPDE